MQVSPCHPRSSIFATATAMPALIFSASKPGGRAGSEKSTVSGFWPTNKIRVIVISPRGRRASEALSAVSRGGSPEGQDAQCERPDVAIQYEKLLRKSAEWRLGNDDANERDEKESR